MLTKNIDQQCYVYISKKLLNYWIEFVKTIQCYIEFWQTIINCTVQGSASAVPTESHHKFVQQPWLWGNLWTIWHWYIGHECLCRDPGRWNWTVHCKYTVYALYLIGIKHKLFQYKIYTPFAHKVENSYYNILLLF